MYFVQLCSCQNGSLWLRTCTIGSLCKTLQPWKAAGFQVLVLAEPSWKASVWIVFIWCWSTTWPISGRWTKRGGATARFSCDRKRLRECGRRFEQSSSFFQRSFLNSLYGLLTRWTRTFHLMCQVQSIHVHSQDIFANVCELFQENIFRRMHDAEKVVER